MNQIITACVICYRSRLEKVELGLEEIAVFRTGGF